MKDIIIINGKKVSKEVLTARFACDYTKCKGACCYETLSEQPTLLGGLLTKEERDLINSNKDSIAELIQSKQLRERFLKEPYEKFGNVFFTSICKSKCVFESKEGCILKNHQAFRRVPYSCGLYPLDINRNGVLYIDDLWISKCVWGWKKGSIDGTFLIDFVKDSIIGFYGEDFYNSLKDVQQKLGIV